VASVSRPSNKKSQTSLTTCTGDPTFPQLEHEVVEGHKASHGPLNVLDVPELAYFSDGRDLVGVHFDVVLSDDVPQKLSSGDPEGAFFLGSA
jgi:hypothetical protein